MRLRARRRARILHMTLRRKHLSPVELDMVAPPHVLRSHEGCPPVIKVLVHPVLSDELLVLSGVDPCCSSSPRERQPEALICLGFVQMSKRVFFIRVAR